MYKILLLFYLIFSYTKVFAIEETKNNNHKNVKIFITSIPKSGTFLLAKLITLLTTKTAFYSESLWLLDEKSVKELSPATYIIGHAHPSQNNKQIIKIHNLKGVFISRDPRDQIVSFAYWINHTKAWPFLANLTIPQLIDILIDKASFVLYNANTKYSDHSTASIDTLYRKDYLGWLNEPSVYTTTFEKLVGPLGGGTKKAQLTEIQNIARHIGQSLSIDQADNIARQLFGNPGTFRKGKIGSWKTHFTQKQKNAFKKIAGQLVIDTGYEKDFNW